MIRNRTADKLAYKIAEVVSRYHLRYEHGDLDQKERFVGAFKGTVQALYENFGRGNRETFRRRFLNTAICLDDLAEKMGLDPTRL